MTNAKKQTQPRMLAGQKGFYAAACQPSSDAAIEADPHKIPEETQQTKRLSKMHSVMR